MSARRAAIAFLVCTVAATTARPAAPPAVTGPALHVRESLAQALVRTGPRQAPSLDIRETRKVRATFDLAVDPALTGTLNGASRVTFRLGVFEFDTKLSDDPAWTPSRRVARFRLAGAAPAGNVTVQWTSRRVTVRARGTSAALLHDIAPPLGASGLQVPADATISVGTGSWFYLGTAAGRARVRTQTILGEAHEFVKANVAFDGAAASPSADGVAPVVHVEAPAHGGVVIGSPTIVRGTASDDRGLAHVYVSLDGGPETDVPFVVDAPSGSPQGQHATFLVSLPLAGNGMKTLTARAVDAGGNASADTFDFTFTDLADTALAAGADSSYVVRDGLVYAWGRDDSGEIGDGPAGPLTAPSLVSQFANVRAISSSNGHTVALRTDGTVWCSGKNASGQLGDGTKTPSDTPVGVLGLTDVRAVAAGFEHSVALRADGTVWCWGTNGNGECGDGSSGGERLQPVQATGVTGAVSIAAGYGTSYAVLADGTARSWGYGAPGALGVTAASTATPQVVGKYMAGGFHDVVEIAAGDTHALALKSDGTVWAWGFANLGALGEGDTAHEIAWSPIRVTGVSGATSVAASGYASAVLLADGTVVAFGNGSWGELGDGTLTLTGRATPKPVSGLVGVVRLGSGHSARHFLAQRADGTIVAWGAYTTGTPIAYDTVGAAWHPLAEVIDLP